MRIGRASGTKHWWYNQERDDFAVRLRASKQRGRSKSLLIGEIGPILKRLHWFLCVRACVHEIGRQRARFSTFGDCICANKGEGLNVLDEMYWNRNVRLFWGYRLE